MSAYYQQQGKRLSLSAALSLLAMVMGLNTLVASAAQAKQQCVPAAYLQRNATQSYLIRMTQIGYAPMGGDEYAGARIDTRGARFEVLKVYSGDVDALSELQNATLEIRCNNRSTLGCSVLEENNYPFYVGQMFVLYDKPNADGVVKLSIAPCPDSKRFILNEEDVAEFEKLYPPIWESEAWLSEHPSSSDSPVPSRKPEIEETQTEDGKVILRLTL